MYKFNGFTEKANNAINLAIESAQDMGHTYIGSEHILLGLLKNNDGAAYTVLEKCGASADTLENLIKQEIGTGSETKLSPDDFTPRVKRVLQTAIIQAGRMGHNYVGTEHILIALIADGDSYAVRFLRSTGVQLNSIVKNLNETLGSTETENGFSDSDESKPKNSSTKMLDKFGRDLTEIAKKGGIDPVIGRQNEIERVIQILSRRTKNNPCLIGEPGVGKTAVAEGLALKIVSGDVPEPLKDKRIVALDLTSMIAGTKYRGDFEDRISNAIDEVKKAKNVILFIDELHTIIGAGSAEGSADTANILKPSLARGDFQVIGATTINEYRKYIEKDAALERRFQPVNVGEPTEEEAVLILRGLRDRYEAHHKVKITDEAIDAAVKLSARYIADRFLPDKAIDLVDEAASRVRLRAYTAPDDLQDIENKIKSLEKEKAEAVNNQDFEHAAAIRDEEKKLRTVLEDKKKIWHEKNEHKNGEVTSEDIAEIVSSWTGVPVVQLTQEESQRLLKLEDILQERIVGQNEAVTADAKAIRRGRVGLKDPNRPVGSFIFLGPTGVGKTELCKALAQAMFGDENAMIRFDMSEFMEKHTVSKLIGSPPGYVGYDEGGQLTEMVRRKPYSVLLFDEIEKAHPDVFNILLQILEDGTLTDGQGTKVKFNNSIVILTSNLGAEDMYRESEMGFAAKTKKDAKALEAEHAANEAAAMKALRKLMRPELVNRFDSIITFNALSEKNVETIFDNMIEDLKKRLATKSVGLQLTSAAKKELISKGYDSKNGARPLRREIEDEIESLLADNLLAGKLNKGDIAKIDFKKSKFTLSITKE